MSQLPPEIQILRLANAHQLSRAVHVAARLELGRHLAGGPLSTAELARETSTVESVLRRFLRFLATLGIVAEADADAWAATPLTAHLPLADNIAQGEEGWAVWGALPDALKDGRPPFESVHGLPFYEYAARNPRQQAHWKTWNEATGAAFYPAVIETLELDGESTVVDVGGGEGRLLAEILKRGVAPRGVLFDLPDVVAEASGRLAADGLADRVDVVGGDARHGVAAGGDVYLLSRVLMNHGDDDAVAILVACRAALADNASGRVLAVETLMPPVGDPRRRALAGGDLNLFLLWGGGHRERGEMETLFERAGLVLAAARPAGQTGWEVLEGRIQAG